MVKSSTNLFTVIFLLLFFPLWLLATFKKIIQIFFFNYFPTPSFCNTLWAVESSIFNNHLRASIFYFGLYDWLHLQSILWHSVRKMLEERRCFTGRQWQCRERKGAANFLPCAWTIVLSVCSETRSELGKWYCKKLSAVWIQWQKLFRVRNVKLSGKTFTGYLFTRQCRWHQWFPLFSAGPIH